MNNTSTNQVTAFLDASMKRCGRDAASIARAIPELRERDVHAILNGSRPMPFEHVAAFARELRADPMVLLEHCIAQYAPATYEDVADRFASSMTADEMGVIDAMRNFANADFLSGQTPLQRQKMCDWLSSLRAPTPSIH